MKRMQYKKICNMKGVQDEESATRKKYNPKNVQQGKSATREKCITKRV